eukprot:GGOE01054263.1.p1 GENE.GGOE01054263.1~~GGOE01054263.1.p1  ORF type:complete len:317 (-),score=79.05 GGOE01054263.1:170-1081(-)
MDNFLCAGFAAAGAICIMNPVDVVKTRLQFQGELGHQSRVYSGVLQSLAQIGRLEGLRGLYRGLSAAVMLQFSVTATRFGTYFLFKQYLGIETHTQHFYTNLGLSLVSSFVGGMCGTPFFALKTQFQAMSDSKHLAVGHQHDHAGLWQAIRSVYLRQGVAGYFRGVQSFVPRVMAYGSVSLATYDSLKPVLIGNGIVRDGPQAHALASFVAAGFAVGAMQPFDLVAARLMNQPVVAGVGQLYSGPIDCCAKVVQAEGMRGLFKGCVANYARMGPYTVLTFVFFENLKRGLARMRSNSRQGQLV